MNETSILSVKMLSKNFEDLVVIKDLSFNIHKGERMALIAPSGAGKTTLINILAGFEIPDGGQFTFQETNPITIFQEPRLFTHLTVEENIFLPYRLQKIKPSIELREEYRQWLEICELISFSDSYPYQLSGGMKQKVAIIRGLLGKPGFVLMDEPFKSISTESKEIIIDHIKRTNPGLSMLFVTHIMDEIPLLAQTVLYFRSTYLINPIRIDASSFHLMHPDGGSYYGSNTYVNSKINAY